MNPNGGAGLVRTYYSEAVERAERLGVEWRLSAACVNAPVETFFPEPHPGRATDYEPGLAVCRGCPVAEECYRWATTAGEVNKHGHTLHGQVVAGCAPKPKGFVGRPAKRPSGGQVRAMEDRAEPRHGSASGYKQHIRLGEEACHSCRQANTRYVEDYKKRKRKAS